MNEKILAELDAAVKRMRELGWTREHDSDHSLAEMAMLSIKYISRVTTEGTWDNVRADILKGMAVGYALLEWLDYKGVGEQHG